MLPRHTYVLTPHPLPHPQAEKAIAEMEAKFQKELAAEERTVEGELRQLEEAGWLRGLLRFLK